jgi:hypothetical protein
VDLLLAFLIPIIITIIVMGVLEPRTTRWAEKHIDQAILQRLAKLAVSDPDSQVRQLAHDFLVNYEDNLKIQQVNNL